MRGSPGFGISSCYLDQGTSNFTLSGNTCAKCGDWALHINGCKSPYHHQRHFRHLDPDERSGPVSPAWGPCENHTSGSAGASYGRPVSLN